MTPEGKVVALIKKRIKEAGGEVRKCAWENCRGAPDLLVMLPGIHAWIEAKTETGKLGPHQAREHTRMATAGCKVYVVFGEDQAQALVSHLISVSRSGVEEQYA